MTINNTKSSGCIFCLTEAEFPHEVYYDFMMACSSLCISKHTKQRHKKPKDKTEWERLLNNVVLGLDVEIEFLETYGRGNMSSLLKMVIKNETVKGNPLLIHWRTIKKLILNKRMIENELK